MRTLDIYLGLFVVTTLYAGLLARYKHVWEPDFTWLEVVVGVAACLIAPYLDQRYNGPLTSEVYELRVWQSFLVGGAPVIIWSIGRTVRAWRRISRRIWSRDGKPSTETLAGQRGGRAETDD